MALLVSKRNTCARSFQLLSLAGALLSVMPGGSSHIVSPGGATHLKYNINGVPSSWHPSLKAASVRHLPSLLHQDCFILGISSTFHVTFHVSSVLIFLDLPVAPARWWLPSLKSCYYLLASRTPHSPGFSPRLVPDLWTLACPGPSPQALSLLSLHSPGDLLQCHCFKNQAAGDSQIWHLVLP